jgi:hypothetical protein
MAILYDARGNELRGGLPDGVTNETITDARPATAVLGALNAEVLMDLNGAATATFDIRTSAGALTLVFEGSVDGTNYFSLPAFAQQQLIAAAITQEAYVTSVVSATTCSGLYTVGVTGIRRVRCRVSAYTSGNITVGCRASHADLIIYNKQIPANLHVTVTAAANTGATITLPAAGAGLFHYITSIELTRNATAALAGTATLVVTSTNLPGNPAWSFGNAMVAGGTQRDLEYRGNNPLKSLVANTNTTIVMPAAGAAVLWRGNCSYYVGM